MFSAISPILWTAFIAFVLLALAVDLGVFHRQARTISVREATAWSVIGVVVSLAFNLVLLHGEFSHAKGQASDRRRGVHVFSAPRKVYLCVLRQLSHSMWQ